MAAPSKSFTVIADSAIDTDSPITVTLMTQFRDNDIHLEEWLGGSYVAAVDHDHDGVNSKPLDGVFRDAQIFLSTGTTFYTKTSGTTKIRALCTSGGAGGAGDTNAPGDGGATAWKWIATADESFDPADVNTTNDTITLAGTERANDDKIRLTGSDLPAPLAELTDYWIVQKSGDDVKLAASKGGAAITITDQGTGQHALVFIGFDVVVGVGGNGVASAPAGNGGASSIGSHCSCTGATPTAPGAPSGGDYGGRGGKGHGSGNLGGSSFWGGCAGSTVNPQTTYGVGANGSNNSGAQGIAIIWEFS